MQRVVVTGMGCVCPIGNTVQEMWQGIERHRCGIGPITHFDAKDHKVKVAAEVKDLDTQAYFSPRDLKFNDRFTQLARISAKQAMIDSQVSIKDPSRFGVLLGSGIGGIETITSSAKRMMMHGPQRVSPYFIPMSLINLAAGQVAIDWHAQGYCTSVVSACAAGANAIGDAFHLIREGKQDVMLAGGTEAAITSLAMAGLQSMRALYTGSDPQRASIPFDADRSGFVMGEGAGMLVLESYEHAKARQAKIYAEICGYGLRCDAHHITAPLEDGSGAALAMQTALADARIHASDIDYINAHGTSTPLNDKAETKAIHTLFRNIAVSSTKSNLGHLLGASGAVETIVCIEALLHQMIPATIHYQVYDPTCDLDIVPNENRKATLNYVMTNSLGFGGHNVSLIFKKGE